jgi:hypothetical protein
VLKDHNYRRCVAPKVPFLTAEQKETRLNWAEEKQGWEVDGEWSDVMRSDECYVTVGGSGRIFVTRRPDEKWEECVVPKFSQAPIRVMVWGCIAKGYRGRLAVLELKGGEGGGLTAALYQEQVLDDILLPDFQELRRERPDLQFQQDGAPAHRAISTKLWLERHSIPTFPHPPNSPDVSPH